MDTSKGEDVECDSSLSSGTGMEVEIMIGSTQPFEFVYFELYDTAKAYVEIEAPYS